MQSTADLIRQLYKFLIYLYRNSNSPPSETPYLLVSVDRGESSFNLYASALPDGSLAEYTDLEGYTVGLYQTFDHSLWEITLHQIESVELIYNARGLMTVEVNTGLNFSFEDGRLVTRVNL